MLRKSPMFRYAAAALLLVSCSRKPPDATPEGALRQWLELMEESVESPSSRKAAYALLGPKARSNLKERATRTSVVIGRRIEPYEALAQGWFSLRFRHRTMRAELVGDTANVFVEGYGDGEHATVTCVRELGHWRVEPVLPEL